MNRNKARTSRMAVASFGMSIMFLASIPFTGVAWKAPSTAAVVFLFGQFVMLTGAFSLGMLAVIRTKLVDKTIGGIPYAFFGIIVPTLWIAGTIAALLFRLVPR